jgi:predicted small lipoprotein YifL
MMVLRLGIISLMVAIALAGCGRKGSFESPKSTVEAPASATNDPGAVTPAAKPAKPDKPFLLDGLI